MEDGEQSIWKAKEVLDRIEDLLQEDKTKEEQNATKAAGDGVSATREAKDKQIKDDLQSKRLS